MSKSLVSSRSFTDEEAGTFWLEQNGAKTSNWAKFASRGHAVAWEFGTNRRYTGRMLFYQISLRARTGRSRSLPPIVQRFRFALGSPGLGREANLGFHK
ncbi:hypothetical protein HDF16_001617 [Granulicella aggregans]|uniref:Uncharacterized protein n=1 Tax=Granulicella aggregans TaxID=474949 RepID=A0A7W7ZBU5_9BACT|nr:hypothetical protein [Granulicella aggregans]